MEGLKLSVEELMYCFFNKGFYLEAMDLKQTYFPELNDENLEVILETSCRALLARDYLDLKNHKYELKNEISSFIDRLHFSIGSFKLSRRRKGKEESISLHLGEDNEFISHELTHDDQLHQINKVTYKQMLKLISNYFGVPDIEQKEAKSSFEFSQNDFEKLLGLIEKQDEDTLDFIIQKTPDKSAAHKFKKAFFDCKGYMDSLVCIKFDDMQTTIDKLFMFIISENNAWQVEYRNEFYIVENTTQQSLKNFIDNYLVKIQENVTT